MATYWYSTNGMHHKRLSNRHTSLLDQAFDRRIRVQIYDVEAFGPSVVAVANPFAGTMIAGDIHYGLYRHPSLALTDTISLDTLELTDSENLLLQLTRGDNAVGTATTRSTHSNTNNDDVTSTTTFAPPRHKNRRKKRVSSSTAAAGPKDDHECLPCCILSWWILI